MKQSNASDMLHHLPVRWISIVAIAFFAITPACSSRDDETSAYKSRFDQPFWLTEFACDSAGSLGEQKEFLVDALEYLENEPRIARYAWFSGRADNVQNASLLGADGELNELGQAYVGAPQRACDE